MKMNFALVRETKTCYVFQHGQPRTDEHITLYLKKSAVDAEKIDPSRGITVTVEQADD